MNVLDDLSINGNRVGSVILPITIADCENTASEVAILQVVVPPNTWLNGERIELQGLIEIRQNSGGTLGLDIHSRVNGTDLLYAITTVNNSAGTGRRYAALSFLRHNDAILSSVRGDSNALVTSLVHFYPNAGFGSTDIFSSVQGGAISGVDFTSNITLALSYKWASANANAYIRTRLGRAFKYR